MFYSTNPENDLLEVSAVVLLLLLGGHGGRVVTVSPPISEIGVQFPA